jgi:hypothetical protein
MTSPLRPALALLASSFLALAACTTTVEGLPTGPDPNQNPNPNPQQNGAGGCLADGSGALDSPEWEWGNEIECSAEPWQGRTRVIAYLRESQAAFQGFRIDIEGFAEGQLADDLPAVVTRDIANYDWATWSAEEGCTVSITENALLSDTAAGREYRISGSGSCSAPLEGDGFYGQGTFALPSFSFTVRGLFP